MRILVTNDDGINSPSLHKLAVWAKHRLGEVVVCAPKVEQSGKSQAIDIINAVEVKRVDFEEGIEAYAVDSTPADCVRFGIVGLKYGFDLVISGINRGYNMGKDIIYSGTVGAIFEAYGLGVKAVAFSTDYTSFDTAVANLDRVYDYIEDNKLFDLCDLYNVNIPTELKGDILITRQGKACYSDEFVLVDEEKHLYKQRGEFIPECCDSLDYDTNAIKCGYISVCPMTTERCDVAVFKKLTQTK